MIQTADLRNRLQIESTRVFAARRVLGWLGHLARMNVDFMARQLLTAFVKVDSSIPVPSVGGMVFVSLCLLRFQSAFPNLIDYPHSHFSFLLLLLALLLLPGHLELEPLAALLPLRRHSFAAYSRLRVSHRQLQVVPS